MSAVLKDSEVRSWVLLSPRAGAVIIHGTEEYAEHARKQAAWQFQAVVRKRPASEAEVIGKAPSSCWNHPNFENRHVYNCMCEDELCMFHARARLGIEP